MILIVEDEPNSRFLLETYLSSVGYEIRSARSGEEALKKISEESPDAVILDVLLPRMDGYEVCRRLKKSETTRFIPIVLATALRGDEERIKGIEAGADDFINKPFNRVELITRIKSLLRIKRLNDALEQKIEELEKAREKLRHLAVTDGLTSLYNYRAFRRQLKLEISRSQRFDLPFSLLMMDIDNFKQYNDRFGHPSGDRMLKKIAQLLQSMTRDVDCLARYGGDEFILILSGTNKKSAEIVAEKLRKAVEKLSSPLLKRSGMRPITLSIGIASFPEDTEDGETLIKYTDKTLYKAKNKGRNRWVTY
jgi:diguanylate cyclase (GGDEF)-like protein